MTARRIERDLSGVFPENFNDFLAQLHRGDYLKVKYYVTDTELDRLGENLDLNGALDLFAQLKKASQPNASRNAEKFLVNYLRQYPQAAFALVDALDADSRRERFDQSTQLVLWRLLTEAGHSEAQQALMGALTDPNRGHVTHMRALAYAHDFEYPEPDTVQGLWRFYQAQGTARDKTSREFKTMSLYALGTLGSADKLNEAVKTDIARMLADSLKNSSDPLDQALALGAIGNYGDANLLETIQPYFQAEQPQVRAAAFESLRRMQDPRAVETLTRHYAHETSANVRAIAAKTLSKMPISHESIAWAGKTLLQSNASKAQIPLVELLGKTLETYPENEARLRALLQKNPDNRVKREIYQYITP